MILHKLDFRVSLADRKQYLRYINEAFKRKYQSLDKYKEEKEFKRILSELSIEDVIQAIARSERIMNIKESNQIKPINKFGFAYYKDNPSLTIQEAIKKYFLLLAL